MLVTSLVLALREIRRHILRSFLTTLGIIIGISAVIAMVTLGNGLTASIKEQIAALGSNVLIAFPQQTPTNRQPRPFKQDDVDAVQQQISGVKSVAGEVQMSVQAFHNGQNWASRVEGVSNAFMDARGIKMEEGRRFAPVEEESGANVCIIGPKVLEEIFVPDESPLGEQVRLNNVSCTVIGVFHTRAQGGNNQDDDNSVFMPLENVQRRFTGADTISYMVISYDSDYSSAAIQNQLIDLLRERRFLQPDDQNDFNIIDTAALNDTISTVVGRLTLGVAGIAAISLVVGGIGIMNIMLVSVTERTREIGIRMAIGALASEVRLQFLTEAVVLCCFGGLVGVLFGFALGLGLSKLIDVPFVFSFTITVISFGISALIGVIFGYFPARRASALDPIEALRHE